MKTIIGEPLIREVDTIEATVISVSKSEICPYQEEPCPIEPYPKDAGILKIDKIINQAYYNMGLEMSDVKSQKTINNTTRTTHPDEGSGENSQTRPLNFRPLQIGQEVQAVFLLTTRPAKVVYISTSYSSKGEMSRSETGMFKPLPKEDGYYIFTTKIIEYPKTSIKFLPGIRPGNKIRAKTFYDGSILYVEEYEIIS